jgi:hypothetical protein
MRSILPPAPLYLVDLLFYFEGFEVVEFGFMGLKFSVKLILACFFLQGVSRFLQRPLEFAGIQLPASTYCLIPLKQHNSPSFVSSCQIIACVVEFNCGDYVGYKVYFVSTRLNS